MLRLFDTLFAVPFILGCTYYNRQIVGLCLVNMTSHFRFYDSVNDTTVPWNATYTYPSQGTKVQKSTPRIPPKGGSVYAANNVIRLELPAQGFVNPQNTLLAFDLTLAGWGNSDGEVTRLQDNVQSTITRLRLLYGSSTLEDITDYNLIVRKLTEHTSTNQNDSLDQTSISEGIGGYVSGVDLSGTPVLLNTRQDHIQGINTVGTPKVVPNGSSGTSGLVPLGTQHVCTRRYQINLMSGILLQDKLLPTKFMASQFAIEITLAPDNECLFTTQGDSTGAPPTYRWSNICLIPEALDFDASYDEMFIRGLETGGVPIKFSTWNTYTFSNNASSVASLQVQERGRSIKSIFVAQVRAPHSMELDSGATFFDTSSFSASGNTMQEFQFRIGNRYYPAAPVQLAIGGGGSISNGGCEAYVELQKALNTVGDYRLEVSSNVTNWAVPIGTLGELPEYDYTKSVTNVNVNGNPVYVDVDAHLAGNNRACTFLSAVDLESSNGVEISGLNAEEQSDIAFNAKWASAQAAGFNFKVFTFYDALLILRPDNALELVR